MLYLSTVKDDAYSEHLSENYHQIVGSFSILAFFR